MKAIKFDEVNLNIGAGQDQYNTLPAFLEHSRADKRVTACFELDEEDLKVVQETGRIWLSQLTFGNPFQPVVLSVDCPIVQVGPESEGSEEIPLTKNLILVPMYRWKNDPDGEPFRAFEVCVIHEPQNSQIVELHAKPPLPFCLTITGDEYGKSGIQCGDMITLKPDGTFDGWFTQTEFLLTIEGGDDQMDGSDLSDGSDVEVES